MIVLLEAVAPLRRMKTVLVRVSVLVALPGLVQIEPRKTPRRVVLLPAMIVLLELVQPLVILMMELVRAFAVVALPGHAPMILGGQNQVVVILFANIVMVLAPVLLVRLLTGRTFYMAAIHPVAPSHVAQLLMAN